MFAFFYKNVFADGLQIVFLFLTKYVFADGLQVVFVFLTKYVFADGFKIVFVFLTKYIFADGLQKPTLALQSSLSTEAMTASMGSGWRRIMIFL